MAVISQTRADQIKIGDWLDLEGDTYADPSHDNPAAEFDYHLVMDVELETPGCVRIDFNEYDSIGFPVGHLLKRVPDVEA